MTDVIDDTLTWEQRREIRRKKRQELLAEADRIVETTDKVSSSQRSYTTSVDDENFEQDRQRRRREREEKRRKEREELEKQLRDEDDARAERERRREERRRQREEQDTILTKHSVNELQTEKVEAVEELEQTQKESFKQQKSQYAENSEEEDAAERIEEIKHPEVLFVQSTIKRELREDGDVLQELNGQTEKEEEAVEEEVGSGAVEFECFQEKSSAELPKEQRKEWEMKRMGAEEQEEVEEAERRKDEWEGKLLLEKEERTKIMAEGEAKRNRLTKEASTEGKELSTKANAAAAGILKMKDLNERKSGLPKAHKDKPDTGVAKLSSLDDRLKSYKSKAERQDIVRKTSTPKTGRSEVANRLNMWETGKIATPDKTPKKASDTVVVKQSAGVSSRKNLWETGKAASSAEKKSSRAEVHGANFASRKSMWLKATQETAKYSGKPDDTQVIKTGVMKRLNKWEKGEVSGSNTLKQKASHLPSSDVSNRRSRWENISHDTQTQQLKKSPAIHTLITTEVSTRKTMYESKVESKDRKGCNELEEQDVARSAGRSETKPTRKNSSSSGASDDDDPVLSDASDEGQNGQQLEMDSADSDRD